jgi:hypothetical protein
MVKNLLFQIILRTPVLALQGGGNSLDQKKRSVRDYFEMCSRAQFKARRKLNTSGRPWALRAVVAEA